MNNPQLGNIVRFNIDRQAYHLTESNLHHSDTLCGTIVSMHKDSVGVKAMDLWDIAKPIKHFTISKSCIIAIL
jgi:hypothetical protein